MAGGDPPSGPDDGALRRGLGARMVSGSVWTAVDSWAGEGAALVVFLVLAALLGPEVFGVVAMAAVITSLASDLTGAALTRVLVQREALDGGHVDAAFAVVAGLAVAAALLINLAAEPIARLYGQPLVEPLLRWLSLAAVLNAAVAVPAALLTRRFRIARLAVRSVLMVAAGGAVGVGMALAGYGVWALAGQALTQAVVSVLVLGFATEWRPRLTFPLQKLREVAGYMADSFAVQALQAFDKRVAPITLGLVLGPVALGLFNMALRLDQALYKLFVTPTSHMVTPGAARVQDDPARVRRVLLTGTALAALVTFPAFTGFALVAGDLFEVLLNPAWAPAALVAAVLVLRGLATTVSATGAGVLFALGETRALVRVNALAAGAWLVLLPVAAQFGLAAVAAAAVARGIVFAWAPVALVLRRRLGLSLAAQTAAFAPALAAAGVMTLALLAARPVLTAALDPWPRLVVEIGGGALVYALAAALFARAPLREALALGRRWLARAPA